MEDGFHLEDARIAIVGLGLMGGSLALALRGKCSALYGIDSRLAALELALAKQVVDQVDRDAAQLLPWADVLILATPLPAMLDFLRKLPALTRKPFILLDLGSTKKEVVQAMALLPERFDPIGGHPICGKEKAGLENAEAGLFRDAPFVITPLERTTRRARAAAQQIISAVGARQIEMDAGEHDRALAFTSHLPFLLATALAHATPVELSPLIGSGFRSTARIAGSPSSMTLGILQSNRENVLSALRGFRSSLDEIVLALQEGNDDHLETLLDESRTAYQSLVSPHTG